MTNLKANDYRMEILFGYKIAPAISLPEFKPLTKKELRALKIAEIGQHIFKWSIIVTVGIVAQLLKIPLEWSIIIGLILGAIL